MIEIDRKKTLETKSIAKTYLVAGSPLGPTAWKGLDSANLKIPPPGMFGWLGCGLCGPNRKLVGGNLKAVVWPNRKCGCVGSKRKFKEGGGKGPRDPRGTGDGWWFGGGEELGDGGDVPPREMSDSSLLLPPGPGLRARRAFPFPWPDCCCILLQITRNSLLPTGIIVALRQGLRIARRLLPFRSPDILVNEQK